MGAEQQESAVIKEIVVVFSVLPQFLVQEIIILTVRGFLKKTFLFSLEFKLKMTKREKLLTFYVNKYDIRNVLVCQMVVDASNKFQLGLVVTFF